MPKSRSGRRRSVRGFNFDSVWRAIRDAQREAEKQWPVEVLWNLDAIRQFGPTM